MRSVLLLTVSVLSLVFTSCWSNSGIYNSGTVSKMPKVLKVSDFYIDIENISVYKGENQLYYAGIESNNFVDDQSDVASTFLFGKRIYNSMGDYDYLFSFRRYIFNDLETKENEVPVLNELVVIIDEDADTQLILFPSNPVMWVCDDGFYQKYTWRINNVHEAYPVIIQRMLNAKSQIVFQFPVSDHHFFTGLPLNANGLLELPKREIVIRDEQLADFKARIQSSNNEQRRNPKDYITYAQQIVLK